MIDLPRIEDFPNTGDLAFFNHAGVAPIADVARSAITQYAQHACEKAYLGAGWHKQARQLKHAAARLIGVPQANPDTIALIPNTSTGIATVARGLAFHPGDNVVITDVEYPANRYPWQDLEAQKHVELRQVRQRPDRRIDPADVINAIDAQTRVVAVSHVQYSSGHRIDLKPIAQAVHRVGGYLCVDAIQSVGVLPVDVTDMDIDFLAADGHKWMLGPEGCGIFYCRAELLDLLHPPIVGWLNMVDAMDFGNYNFTFAPTAQRFEPGSYNIPGLLALKASVDLLLDVGIDAIWRRVYQLTGQLTQGLTQRGWHIHSPRDHESECSGIVVFGPPEISTSAAKANPGRATGLSCQQIADELERAGVIVAVRNGRLRASPHAYNTPQQIDRLLESLPHLIPD